MTEIILKANSLMEGRFMFIGTPYVHAVTNNYYYLESIQRLLSPVNHRGEQANSRPRRLLHARESDVSISQCPTSAIDFCVHYGVDRVVYIIT